MALVGAALAGKWVDLPSDVVVERVIPAASEAIHAELASFDALQELFPEDCATAWEAGERTSGVGALSRLKYTIGGMNRTLTARISKDEPGRILQLDHEGRKGFFTQFTYEEAAGGATTVTLATYVAPPPWPFRPYFYKKVKPAWEDCHARTLEAVAGRVAAP